MPQDNASEKILQFPAGKGPPDDSSLDLSIHAATAAMTALHDCISAIPEADKAAAWSLALQLTKHSCNFELKALREHARLTPEAGSIVEARRAIALLGQRR